LIGVVEESGEEIVAPGYAEVNMDGSLVAYIYIRNKWDGSIVNSVTVTACDERTIRRCMREAFERTNTETQYIDDRGVRAAQDREVKGAGPLHS
jgi:hypothetical protein